MKIFLVVRALLPWDELDYRSYQTKAGYFAGHWMYRVNISLRSWQGVFNMSFFEYRHKIHLIAKHNWETIKGLEDILISDGGHDKTLEIIDKLRDIRDAIIIPVDDDDWMAPTICNDIEPHCHRPVMHWRQGSYDPYSNKPCFTIRESHNPYHFFTNNYAYSQFLYSFASKFDQAEMTLMHLHFNDMLQKRLFDPIRCNWVSIPKCLGVTNKTLASLSKLNKKNGIIHFHRALDRHKTISQEPLGLKTLMETAPWALRYVKETEQLHHDLEESKRWNLLSTLDSIAGKKSHTKSVSIASSEGQASPLPSDRSS